MKRNEYTIYSDKVESDKNIAILSDIHINRKTPSKKLDDVINTIEKIEPTHIVIPGDLYDVEGDSISNIKTSEFIKGLSSITNVFYVKGNIEQKSNILPHEFYNNRNHNFHPLCEKVYGECHYIKKDNINISGLKLQPELYQLSESERIDKINKMYQSYLEKVSELCGNENFNILLCHDPLVGQVLKNIDNNFDLVISGHNHGGIWPTWMKPIFKLTRSNMDLVYPTYIKGMIGDNHKLVISEGITKYNSSFGALQLLERNHEGTIENVKILKK